MQAVGQFEEQRPHVVIYGLEYLLEILHLFGTCARVLLFLGDYVDQISDVIAESFPDLVYGPVCIFHDVVEKGGDNSVCVQFQFFCDN